MNIKDKIKELKKLKPELFGKDFLLTWEKSEDDLRTVLKVAEILKDMRDQNISASVFDSGLAVSNFRDNSTREKSKATNRQRTVSTDSKCTTPY